MQSTSPTICIKCGNRLSAGINFRQVKDMEGQVIGARCFNACLKPAEPEKNPLCGHDLRFEIEAPEGERGCVLCVAVEAIQIGKMQADDWDRFWAAMGVFSSEITVDQAVAKWKAMETVMQAAKGMRFKDGYPGKYVVNVIDLAKLHEALRVYDQQPHVVPVEETTEESVEA